MLHKSRSFPVSSDSQWATIRGPRSCLLSGTDPRDAKKQPTYPPEQRTRPQPVRNNADRRSKRIPSQISLWLAHTCRTNGDDRATKVHRSVDDFRGCKSGPSARPPLTENGDRNLGTSKKSWHLC